MRDPPALLSEKEPWRRRPRGPTGEMPRPCRAKRSSRARFDCPGEVSGSRLQAPTAKGAYGRDPSALPSEKEPWRGRPRGRQANSRGPPERKGSPERDPSALFNVKEPCRGRPKDPTSMILSPCQAKRSSRARYLSPAKRKGPLAMAPLGLQGRSLCPTERKIKSEIPWPC